ncbi:MAG: glycosyltransferase family 4 protein [Candidatus Diapherotrites archaeon]|nr:glycosyltransferase family 4 protein [Candidatus Diapherotrites archaeon]
MDICMVNPFFFPYMGGTEKHIYEVGRRLAKNHHVTVLTYRYPKAPKREVVAGMEVIRARALVLTYLPHPLPPPMPLAPHADAVIQKQARYNDLFHFHNRFTYSVNSFKSLKRKGRHVCLTLHNARPQGIDPVTDAAGSFYDDFFGEKIFGQCDRIAAVSRNTLETTLQEEYRGKASVVYNGVNLEDYDPRMDCSDTLSEYGDFVFSNGRLVEQKGFKYLLEAAKSIDSHIVILGRGQQKKRLKRLAPDNVTFITKPVSEEILACLYGAAKAFVLSSLYEPFGMAFLEAMAMETPVVGTTVGGIPEIVTKEVGRLVPPRDPAAIAEAVNSILASPAQAKRMGHAGRKRVQKNFTWDHSAQGYEKLYASLE